MSSGGACGLMASNEAKPMNRAGSTAATLVDQKGCDHP
jgi:hypothetical protein